MAVIVIEAKYRSGSTITARYALEQGKEVFCLPHRLEDKYGVGCNRLIQKGAKLITKVSELEKYLEISIEKRNIENNMKKPNITLPNGTIEQEYRPIYEMLLQHPMSSNELALRLKWPISSINQTLTIMEIKGYIQALPGNEFQIKEE